MMRWLYIGIIGVFAAAIIIFVFQNRQPVSLGFLGLNIEASVALMSSIIYLLGMATGSSLIALLRWSIEGARREPPRHGA